jgi:uncharacterized membrane protein YgaE (UPF0421/DUF939 family)
MQRKTPLPSATQIPELSPVIAPANPAAKPAFAYLADSYIYHWDLASFRTDWFFTLAVALCLGVGIALGHPAAGMIAAGGAMTAGFGAKQNIDGSPLLPILFVSFGMAFSTFVGMVAGHGSWTLTGIATVFGFGYGMMSKREAGFSWVGQQCVVTLLVASAFPFSPRDAAVRALLIFVGGIVQLLMSSVMLRAFGDLRKHVLALATYVRDEEQALRRTYLTAVLSLRHRQLRDSVLPYATRLAVVLAISTEIYRQLHFASGYWIPMTALLVLRPGIADTASRAIARTIGTLAGAVLSSIFLVYVHPPPAGLAALVVLFTWLSYSVLNVNYALFSIFLTSYIVFLLSLNNIPGADIAHRRFVCTMLGGAIALSVRLFVLRLRQKQDRDSIQTLVRRSAIPPEQEAVR